MTLVRMFSIIITVACTVSAATPKAVVTVQKRYAAWEIHPVVKLDVCPAPVVNAEGNVIETHEHAGEFREP
jgi:hypothetical protein